MSDISLIDGIIWLDDNGNMAGEFEGVNSTKFEHESGDWIDDLISMVRSLTMTVERLNHSITRMEAKHSSMRRYLVKGKRGETPRILDMKSLKIAESLSFVGPHMKRATSRYD